MNDKVHFLHEATPSRLGEVAGFSNAQKPTQTVKDNKETGICFKWKKKNSEKDLNEIEISDLPDKEFKILVIKILTELGRRMNEYSENFNKETENIRKYQTEVMELKNTITSLKNTTERFNSRLDEKKRSVNLKIGQWTTPKQSNKINMSLFIQPDFTHYAPR